MGRIFIFSRSSGRDVTAPHLNTNNKIEICRTRTDCNFPVLFSIFSEASCNYFHKISTENPRSQTYTCQFQKIPSDILKYKYDIWYLLNISIEEDNPSFPCHYNYPLEGAWCGGGKGVHSLRQSRPQHSKLQARQWELSRSSRDWAGQWGLSTTNHRDNR